MLDSKLRFHIDALGRMLVVLGPFPSLSIHLVDNLRIVFTVAIAAAVNEDLVGGGGVFGRERERVIVGAGGVLALGNVTVRIAIFAQPVREQRGQYWAHDGDAGTGAAYARLEY